MALRQVGDYIAADYFNHTGGLNTADSPFVVSDSQATGGQNYEYVRRGGFSKIKGATKINTIADSALRTLGMGMHVTSAGTKTPVRFADRKVQTLDPSALTVTATLTEDTGAAGSNFFANATTSPVVNSQFNTSTINVLWLAGGGLTNLYGMYSTTKVTANGVPSATGSIALSAGSTGGTLPTGTYYYAIVVQKGSTSANSNAALDKSVAVTSGQKVTIDLTSVSTGDNTKYTNLLIYRSAVGGVSGFTTGDLIATVASGTTSYVDDGSIQGTAANVPRFANTVLDNSVLPSGTFNCVTTFKRRLITASGSTIYMSDLNKPESWPAFNYITVPSAGQITGLAVLSFTTPTSTSIDEILVIFKENELWVVTGTGSLSSGIADWSLKFIDNVGCVSQPLVVNANGYLFWIDYSGVYMWDGSGKPIYLSRPIEDLFDDVDGDVDKSKLSLGWGVYFRQKKQVIWVLSDLIQGEQKWGLKLDIRLTLPAVQSNLSGRVVDGVFMQSAYNFALYGGASVRPQTAEEFIAGDASGFIYKMLSAFDDAGSGINFTYETKFMEIGSPGVVKRYRTVIVWVEDTSDANLELDYWTGYSSGTGEQKSLKAQISKLSRASYYDLAYYDVAYWDNTLRGYNPLVFNLANSEGDCLKLRFLQTDANAPVTIAGYTVLFNEISSRK